MTDGRNTFFQPHPCQRFQQLDTITHIKRYNERRQLDSKDKQGSEREVRQVRERKWVLGSTQRKDSQLAVQEWFPLIDLAPCLKNTKILCYI